MKSKKWQNFQTEFCHNFSWPRKLVKSRKTFELLSPCCQKLAEAQKNFRVDFAPSRRPPQSITPKTHSPKPSLSNNHRPRLIFVSSVVAREPHPRKIPPPLSVPSNFQNRLKTSDLVFIARQLEYGVDDGDRRNAQS